MQNTEAEQLADRTGRSPAAMSHGSFIELIERLGNHYKRDPLTNIETPAVAEKVGEE